MAGSCGVCGRRLRRHEEPSAICDGCELDELRDPDLVDLMAYRRNQRDPLAELPSEWGEREGASPE